MTGLDTDLATLREALAIGWPEGDHAEPHVFTEALDALARVRDSLERLQSLWLAERELRLAEQAAHRQTNEEAEALAEELERLQEPRDETGYPAWSGLPNDPLVRFTSASWHCPVCDRRGDVHDERCLVLELVTVARRRKDGNRRLVETNGRLRETAEAAEARCAAMEECDCIPAEFSSKACSKCGRRGVVTETTVRSLMIEIQDEKARCARLTEENERLDGLRALYLQSADDWSERCAQLQQALRFCEQAAEELLELEEPAAEVADVASSSMRAILSTVREALAAQDTLAGEYHAEGLDERGIYGGKAYDTPAAISDEGMIQPHYRPGDLDTPADSQEDEWFIPEGDRQCGVVHKMARATCMKRRGHDGSHATPQGTWIDGPWCEYPPLRGGAK